MSMSRAQFEEYVAEAFSLISEELRKKVKNLVFLVEDEVSDEIRKEQGLGDNETLLGLYTGIPLTARGGEYGIGVVMPDTIHIYQRPIEEAAKGDEVLTKEIIRDTVWHEVAHYFGFEEEHILRREMTGTNKSQRKDK